MHSRRALITSFKLRAATRSFYEALAIFGLTPISIPPRCHSISIIAYTCYISKVYADTEVYAADAQHAGIYKLYSMPISQSICARAMHRAHHYEYDYIYEIELL